MMTGNIVPTAILLLSLGLPGLAQPAPPNGAGDQPRAWVKKGIVGASTMEALSFVLRRGGQPADYAARWRDAMSENEARRLKESGVTIVLVTLMKGAGIKAEAADIEAARKFVDAAHRYGIKVGGYVGGSMFFEQMFAEEPESKDWIQRDEFGRVYHYQPAQTFRYMACRNNPGYVAYIKKALKLGVADLKMDMIHFDQLMWRDAPRSCHCDVCQKMFREYVRQRYPADLALRRFGYSDLPVLRIPEFGIPGAPINLPQLINPLMQEWAMFRVWSLARHYKDLSGYIHGLNPAAAVQGNPTMYPEANAGFMWGVDISELLESGDMVWSEEGNHPAWTPDGRLVTMIRTYKEVRTMGKNLWLWQARPDVQARPASFDDSVLLGMGEALAFNDRNLGVVAGLDVGISVVPPNAKRYVDFFHHHGAELTGTHPVADAAVLRTFASNEFNPAKNLVSTVLYEQALIQGKVPFAIIFGKHLKKPLPYKVLVAANQDALSDQEVSAIRAFVAGGGGLVATEDTSMLTDWRLTRPKFGLADVLGIDRPESAGGRVIRREFGKGRVVYLPAIERAVAPPPPSMTYFFFNRYWKLPGNHLEMLDAVKWAAGGNLSAEIEAPLWVTAELARQGDERLLLHLLNYKTAEMLSDIRASVRIPAGFRVVEAYCTSPDREVSPAIGEKSPLRIEQNGPTARFVVPRLKIYDLIVLGLGVSGSRD